MSGPKRVGEIQVDQDLDFQRGEWRFQSAGRIALALILLVGVLGLLGNGPLAHAKHRSAAGDIIVEYDRIVRHHSDTELSVALPAHQGQVVVWLSQEYLDGVHLRNIVPDPNSTRSTNERVEFVFDVLPAGRINFRIEPERLLLRTLELGVAGGGSLRIKQFVLP